MHFLRGHMFFLLKVLFKEYPWFDETLTNEQIALMSNTMSSDSLWEKIEDDFQAAVNDLPATQPGEPGRANQLSAKAYLAKALLYHAYTQDDQYNVTGVDLAKLNQVVTLTNDVINSGMYSLNTDYAYNFLDGHDNGPESSICLYNTLSMTEHKSEAD